MASLHRVSSVRCAPFWQHQADGNGSGLGPGEGGAAVEGPVSIAAGQHACLVEPGDLIIIWVLQSYIRGREGAPLRQFGLREGVEQEPV